MSKILFDKNGDLYRVTAYEKLNQEDVDREIAESKERAEELKEAVDFSNKLQTPETTQAETPAPAAETPAPVNIPVNDTTVATPEGVQTQPEAPAAPAVEEPKAEEQAQADPATAPAPVGPAPIVLS